MRYLLDTNILSEPIASRPHAGVLEKIRANGGALALSAVTWQEMLYGMWLLPAGKRREQIEDYLRRRVHPALPILPFDQRAAQWQAEQRVRLRQAGLSPAYPDTQIAAISAVNGLILVTRNRADFTHLTGLVIENWFESDA